jgi:hypothetical protein
MLAEIEQPAAIGHNSPPTLAEQARADMESAAKEIAARAAQLAGGADRCIVIDQESAGKAADLIKMITTAENKLGDIHTTQKAPYLAAGRAVDEIKTGIAGILAAAKALVKTKTNAYLKEEEAKAAAERRRLEEIAREEARKAQEAQSTQSAVDHTQKAHDAIAQASAVAEPVKARGDYGNVVGLKDNWVGTVTDYTLAFAAVASNAKVREAIDKAIQAMVRSGAREIPGVEIINDRKV